LFGTIDQKRQFASNYARKHGIDVSLLCAVIEHESSWNPWAIRYEGGFFAVYILPMAEHLSDTEARARAFSWGLMQLMGQTARELGYTGDLAALCDPDYGTDWGCHKLKKCLDAHVGDVNTALNKYNGGGNPQYAATVRLLMPKYL